MPKTILLVDDENVFRNRVARALRDRGYQTLEAENLAQARDAIAEKPDFAVLDLRLPDGNGMSLLSDFQQYSPQTKVVLLTGYGTITSAVHALKSGAVHYLTKPVNADQIVAAFSDTLTLEQEQAPTPTLEQVEWEHLQRVLTDCGGNISSAAKVLKMHRRSLQRKLLKRPTLIK